MISNEQEFEITKAQFDRLRSAAISFDVHEATTRTGSSILAQAELSAIKSQIEELAADLREYEALNTGAVTLLKARTLSELPAILVRARIAQGFSQAKLASVLGWDERQVRQFESEAYVSASLQQISAAAQSLGLNISEIAEFERGIESDRSKERIAALDWSRFPAKEMFKRN